MMRTVQCSAIQCSTVQNKYSTIRYRASHGGVEVKGHPIPDMRDMCMSRTVWYSTTVHRTVQYTVRHSDVSTVPYRTVWYNTVQYSDVTVQCRYIAVESKYQQHPGAPRHVQLENT